MKLMKCPKCQYGWETRVNKPKACRFCKVPVSFVWSYTFMKGSTNE